MSELLFPERARRKFNILPREYISVYYNHSSLAKTKESKQVLRLHRVPMTIFLDITCITHIMCVCVWEREGIEKEKKSSKSREHWLQRDITLENIMFFSPRLRIEMQETLSTMSRWRGNILYTLSIKQQKRERTRHIYIFSIRSL